MFNLLEVVFVEFWTDKIMFDNANIYSKTWGSGAWLKCVEIGVDSIEYLKMDNKNSKQSNNDEFSLPIMREVSDNFTWEDAKAVAEPIESKLVNSFEREWFKNTLLIAKFANVLSLGVNQEIVLIWNNKISNRFLAFKSL